MHDAFLEALVKSVHVPPFLLVHIAFVSGIPLNFLPTPQGSLDAGLEVLNALILKQQVEALDPFLLARFLPFNLEALSWPEALSICGSIPQRFKDAASGLA